MKGGAMSGWTATLIPLVAAFLLLSHWLLLGGVFLGNPYADVIPAVFAIGGFIAALSPSKFPGVAWRLIAAVWLAVAIAIATLVTLAHVSPCRQNCRDESDIMWAIIKGIAVAFEALVISSAIGAGILLGRVRRREHAAR